MSENFCVPVCQLTSCVPTAVADAGCRRSFEHFRLSCTNPGDAPGRGCASVGLPHRSLSISTPTPPSTRPQLRAGGAACFNFRHEKHQTTSTHFHRAQTSDMRTVSTIFTALIIACLLAEGAATIFYFKCSHLTPSWRRICSDPSYSAWCTCESATKTKPNLRLVEHGMD
jgi:hypothetical protein